MSINEVGKQKRSSLLLTELELSQEVTRLLDDRPISPLLDSLFLLPLLPSPHRLLLLLMLDLLVDLQVQFLNVDLAILIIESNRYLNDPDNVDILQFLDGWQDIGELLLHDGLFAVLQNRNATAVEEEITTVPFV